MVHKGRLERFGGGLANGRYRRGAEAHVGDQLLPVLPLFGRSRPQTEAAQVSELL